MKRIVFMVTVALVMAAMMALAGPASATIHPIVESFDCVGTDVPEGHPTGDVADPPGQTPGFGSHSEQSDLRAGQARPNLTLPPGTPYNVMHTWTMCSLSMM